MKLHYSSASPYARKVLISAIELGLRERIEVVTSIVSPTAPNATVAMLNPLMKVPTLERDDGSPLFDSVVICEYLDTLAKGALFPKDGDLRWQALRKHALADGIMDAALLLRYEAIARPEPLRWSGWVDGQKLKITQALDLLDVEAGRATGPLNIGDIGVICALGYLDFRFALDPWRAGRAALTQWFEAMAQRASVLNTVPAA